MTTTDHDCRTIEGVDLDEPLRCTITTRSGVVGPQCQAVGVAVAVVACRCGHRPRPLCAEHLAKALRIGLRHYSGCGGPAPVIGFAS